ncbi:hypothetical protein VP01_3348g2 [Puccinia sorghi]|uniref:YCII-related domain-containing protein n=1 Tax=Puccinia sorghi TaxID=27349 RepID=A0A0L6UX25_9BASI|nr:hypothetical protein VP01_3348g2 [Puccinia sorghi]
MPRSTIITTTTLAARSAKEDIPLPQQAVVTWRTPLSTQLRAPSSTSPDQLDSTTHSNLNTYLVIAPDLKDSNRCVLLKLREEHIKMAKEGLNTGRIVNGGAMLDSDPSESNSFLPKMTGSWLLIKASSIDEARQMCLNDVYSTQSAWDVTKLQITPVKTIV